MENIKIIKRIDNSYSFLLLLFLQQILDKKNLLVRVRPTGF